MTTRTENTKRSRGIVALGAGAALLLAGSSFALWHDQSRAEVGTLTTGQLAVQASEVTWRDGSTPSHEDPINLDGSQIDIDDFVLAPGDRLIVEQEVDLALEGDNLTAEAEISLENKQATDLLDSGYVQLQLVAYRDGKEIDRTWVEGGYDWEKIRLEVASQKWYDANHDPDWQPDLIPVGTDLDGEADVTVNLEVEFLRWVQARDKTQLTGDLGQLQTVLTQVR